MNCVPGDMAVIVRSLRQENIGAIVEVLRPSISSESAAGTTYFECGNVWLNDCGGFIWVVKATGRKIVSSNNSLLSEERPYGDCCLRPIRPQSDDTPDESAAWLSPVPSTQQVAA